jgi:hypothetical protein
MKILITVSDGINNIVQSVSSTNITDPADVSLITVGGSGVHLVDDIDAHVIGDVFVGG